MRREGDLRLVERLCDGALRVRRHVGARWCSFGTSGASTCADVECRFGSPFSFFFFADSNASYLVLDLEDARGDW